MTRLRLSSILALLLFTAPTLAATLAPTQARAQARADLIPLGRSAAAGAICQAVRDYDDPVAAQPPGRVWRVRCAGWDASVGRVYLLPRGVGEARWRKLLAERADCQDSHPQVLNGISALQRQTCRTNPGGSPYLVYIGRRGRYDVAAEGYAQLADILETGMRVVAGAQAAPKFADVQMSRAAAEIAADFGGSMSGLAGAQTAAAMDPNRLLTRGYVQNNEWRFGDAESDFRTVVAALREHNAPPAQRAEALINLALNVSDSGRFKEADTLFAQADADVALAKDPLLRARVLYYRALHLRNQGRFADAAAMAEQAIHAGEVALDQPGAQARGPAIQQDAGALVIGADLAHSLNTRSMGEDLMGGEQVSPASRLQVQQAAALDVIGSCKAALGDLTGAAQSLQAAHDRLAAAEAAGGTAVSLDARIQADLAELDMRSNRPAAAADRYQTALRILRTRHAGSSTEARMLMDLGRADIAAGRPDAALTAYGQAFSTFKSARGSLGGSASAAQPYFDLLLSQTQKDPAHAQDYDARFFAAAETVVSEATASTVARLAARVAAGEGAAGGLARALDDARRRVDAAEGRIAALQIKNAYTGPAKTDADADLKTLEADRATLEGELLSVSPRYGQLVSSDATLDQVQKALRPDEVFVKTLLLANGGYGLLVSQGAVHAYPIAMTSAQAVRAARSLRAPFEAEENLPPFDVALAHDLFARLFGPVQAQLLGARHLIYEPDAQLVSVPSALFVTDGAPPPMVAGAAGGPAEPDYRVVKWLGARMDSSLVLSASSFLQSRAFRPSQAKQNFLGFGDPDLPRAGPRAFASVLKRSGPEIVAGAGVCNSTRQALLQLPALPDTAGELRSVSASFGAPAEDVVTGQAFNDAAVRGRKDLNDFKVVYFATHALLPMPDACLPEPALVTSLGAGNSDGLLDASDLVDLKLDADLVVLSACDTGGAGSDTAAGTGLKAGGEALGGLTRAMIYAGARGLIVSHWPVDSSATVRLMTELFKSGAPSEAEGLQRAQAALQQDPRYAHPYFWAPFTVVGDGARAIPGAAASAPTVKAEAAPARPVS